MSKLIGAGADVGGVVGGVVGDGIGAMAATDESGADFFSCFTVGCPIFLQSKVDKLSENCMPDVIQTGCVTEYFLQGPLWSG